MSPTSMATARFMETWAHALDVYDALGARQRRADRPDPARRPPRRAHPRLRLRRPRARAAGRGVPRRAHRAVRATLWTWGPEDAAQTVTGPAYDFCLRVTQRRHRDDLDLVATGPDADRWLDIAQAFAGPPGAGRTASRAEVQRVSSRPVRIGNCSGFYGDRLSAMREMLEGGELLDYLTGDYLAELTMLILGKDQLRDPSLGYARTFLTQMTDSLALALDRGVRIVANAGGLNPAGLAAKLRGGRRRARPVARGSPGSTATTSRRAPAELGLGDALTANAYLGAFGIARALERGRGHRRHRPGHRRLGGRRAGDRPLRLVADVVRRARRRRRRRAHHRVRHPGHRRQLLRVPRAGPRRHPARLPDRRDRRRRLVRGHQARRHRRAGLGGHRDRAAALRGAVDALPRPRRHHRPRPRSGSSEDGPDRVAGQRRPRLARPPEQLKVCVNELGGYRNQMEFVLTGLDIEAKADWVRTQLEARLADSPPASIDWSLGLAPGRRTPTPRRRRPACCGSSSRTRRPTSSASRSAPRRSSWRWRPTRASR